MLIEQKTYDNLDIVDNSVPIEGSMDVSFFIHCQAYLFVEWLVILFFLAFILSAISYLLYFIKKSQQQRTKIKKIIKWCFYLFILTYLLYFLLIVIFGCSLYLP